MCSDKDTFVLPAFPADKVIDPTGAGDSFAGGMMGYLATQGNFSSATIKRALAFGTVTASFTIADFSLGGLQAATRDAIDDRWHAFQTGDELLRRFWILDRGLRIYFFNPKSGIQNPKSDDSRTDPPTRPGKSSGRPIARRRSNFTGRFWRPIPGSRMRCILLGVLAQQAGKLDVGDAADHPRDRDPTRCGLSHQSRRGPAAHRQAPRSRKRLPQSHRDQPELSHRVHQPRRDPPGIAAARRSDARASTGHPRSTRRARKPGRIWATRAWVSATFEGAIDMGRKAVEAQPDYSVAHNNLAAALEKKDLLTEAEAEYRKAVELDPTFAEALNNLGSVIRRQGDLRTAMHWWQKSRRCALRIWRGALESGAGGAGAGRI